MAAQTGRRDPDTKFRLWRVAGAGALVLGVVGMTLPILPAAPFLLLAAYGFSRGSQRIHQWLVDPSSLGTGFAEWRRQGRVPVLGKLMVVLFMVAGVLAAWSFGLDSTSLIIEAVGLLLVGGYVLTRPSPTPARSAEQAD
ncbi:MAG: YbaN family protein [Kiloniellales bacterium]